MGRPDWDRLLAKHGPPNLPWRITPTNSTRRKTCYTVDPLRPHPWRTNPLPRRPAIIRQSRYCLDEGLYAFGKSQLVVSRGLGSMFLPIRWGADAEAVMIEIVVPASRDPRDGQQKSVRYNTLSLFAELGDAAS